MPFVFSRPPPFVHPSPLHPYAAVLHPLTPLRWLLYVVTAVVTWAALLPIWILWSVMRRLARGCLQVCDSVVPPVHAWTGDAESLSAPAAWFVQQPSLVRLHSVEPQDRIWMVPRTGHAKLAAVRPVEPVAAHEPVRFGAASPPVRPQPSAPGASPSSVIHALLTLSRPVSLLVWQRRFDIAVRKGGPLERMRWRAVRTRTSRRWLHSRFGGQSDGIAWMETREQEQGWHKHVPASDASMTAPPPAAAAAAAPAALAFPLSFDIVRHVRSVPASEWSVHSPFGDHRDRSASARAPDLVWPEATESLHAAPRPAAQHGEQDSERYFAPDAAHAVNHSEVLRTARLQAYLTHLSVVPLLANQPLWELLVLEPDPEDDDGGATDPPRGLAVFRCSHAVADGVMLSGMILRTLFGGGEVQPDHPVPPPIRPPPLARASRPSCWFHCGVVLHRVWSLWLLVWTGPYLLLHKSFQPDDDNTLTRGGGGDDDSEPKQISWSTQPVALADVKKLSRHLHVTINDVLMSVWLDVLDDYMRAVEAMEQVKMERAERTNRARGGDDAPAKAAIRRIVRAPSRVFAIVPFNVRKRHELEWNPSAEARSSSSSGRSPIAPPLGNRFALLMLDVAMGAAIRDAAPHISRAEDLAVASQMFASSPFLHRVRSLSSYMRVIKSSGVESRMMFGVLSVILALPPSIAAFCLELYAGLPSVVITNNRSAEGRIIMKDDAEEAEATDSQMHCENKENSDTPARTVGAVVIHVDSAAASSSSCSASFPRVSPLPLSLAPVHLLDWVSWAPQRNNVGVCVTLISYGGQVRVSIVASQRSIRHTTVTQLVERYQRKLAALLEIVG